MATLVNTEFWMEFIAMYKDHPELWNVGSECYKNRLLKNKAYDKLMHKLKEIDPDATVDLVRRKINSLRSCYRRELLKMVRKNSRPGITEDLLYVPKLWYFDALKFLESEFKNDTVSASEDEIYENYYKSNYEEEIEEPPQKQIKELSIKRGRSVNNSSSEISATNNFKQHRLFEERDEAGIFSETWAVMYRKLSADQQLYAKKAIDEILFQGQLGKLGLNSFKILPHEEKDDNADSNFSFSE